MRNSPINIDMTLVPARILERVVRLKQPLEVLASYESLQGILNTEDLYFYKHVNDNISDYVDEGLTAVFNTGEAQQASKLFCQIDDVSTNMYMSSLSQDKLQMLELLFKCEATQTPQSSFTDSNIYVGQCFSIDAKTIGVVFVESDPLVNSVEKSVRNLMSLLCTDYLNQPDGPNIFEGNGREIRALSESGLLAYYCSI